MSFRAKLRARLRSWLGIQDAQPEVRPEGKSGLNMREGVSLLFRGGSNIALRDVFAAYQPPPGVGPGGRAIPAPQSVIALDQLPGSEFAGVGFGNWAAAAMGPLYNGGIGSLAFFGYPYLSELVQRAEYYKICEIIAQDMTRKWGEVKAGDKKKAKNGEKKNQPASQATKDPFDRLMAMDDAAGNGGFEDGESAVEGSGDPFEELLPPAPPKPDDKKDRIDVIEAELKRLKVRELFYEAAIKDGFFGRYQIVPDFGNFDDPEEMASDLGTGEGKIERDSLKRLVGVEPLWTYPYNYSATDPLSPWWYRPEHWYIMSRQVHTSRILTFVSRPLPDILKPAYNFGGLSLVQLAAPYINKWIATAGSVADIVNSYVVGVLATQMQDLINARANGQSLWERLTLFSATKNNQSVIAIDKDSETYEIRAAPLGGLEGLQAQALEHISTVSQIPSVKWTGNEPAGLNASSEGTIRVYNDMIHASQEALFGAQMERLLTWVQMSKFGDVDPEIHFDFFPLEEESEKDKADLQKSKAETEQILVDIGALGPPDVRDRLSNDSGSPYEGVDPDDLPDLVEEEEEGLEPAEGRPTGLAGGEAKADPFEQMHEIA